MQERIELRQLLLDRGRVQAGAREQLEIGCRHVVELGDEAA